MTHTLQKAADDLTGAGIPVKRNVSLRKFTWLKTGGTLHMLVTPSSIEQMSIAIRALNQHGVIFKVVGETSNLMFLDDREYSCLLCTQHIAGMGLEKKQSQIVVEAGAMLPDLSRFALNHEIRDFAGFEGIPGTIGGAVFMNAGAYGSTVDRVLEKVEIIKPSGQIETLEACKLDFSYRNSVFKKGGSDGIICRSFFRASPGDPKTLYSKMETIHANRHRHFEYMYPNLGSIFAGSVYRSLGNKDRTFHLAAVLFYLLNYRFRPFKRETPINRKWLNDLAIKRFGIQFRKQPFSDKSLNVLINNGHHTDELISYIEQLKELIGSEVPIENEIVQPF